MGLYEDMMEQQKQNIDPETNLPMEMIIGNRRMTGGQQSPMISQEDYESWHALPTIPDADEYSARIKQYYDDQAATAETNKSKDFDKAGFLNANELERGNAIANANSVLDQAWRKNEANKNIIAANYKKYQDMYKMAGGGQTASDPSFDLFNQDIGQANRQIALNNKNIGGYQPTSTPTSLSGDRAEMYHLPLQQQASAPVDVPLEPAKLEKMPDGFKMEGAKAHNKPGAGNGTPRVPQGKIQFNYVDDTGGVKRMTPDTNVTPGAMSYGWDEESIAQGNRVNFNTAGVYKQSFLDKIPTMGIKMLGNTEPINGTGEQTQRVVKNPKTSPDQMIDDAMSSIYKYSDDPFIKDYRKKYAAYESTSSNGAYVFRSLDGTQLEVMPQDMRKDFNRCLLRIKDAFIRLNPEFKNTKNRLEDSKETDFQKSLPYIFTASAWRHAAKPKMSTGG